MSDLSRYQRAALADAMTSHLMLGLYEQHPETGAIAELDFPGYERRFVRFAPDVNGSLRSTRAVSVSVDGAPRGTHVTHWALHLCGSGFRIITGKLVEPMAVGRFFGHTSITLDNLCVTESPFATEAPK